MINNGIRAGNFSRVLWCGGNNYLDAVEDGFIEFDAIGFESIRAEPTYERPILVISSKKEHGTMIGSYVGFLNSKGIGTPISHDTNNKTIIPGFSFVGKKYFDVEDERFYLDSLTYF